jgi:signal peptidase I
MEAIAKESDEIGCGLASEVARAFGEIRLRVSGTSMAPSILPGDVISIRRARTGEIFIGDVILYSRNSRLFAHRVIRRADNADEPCLITRGDRLPHEDPQVSSTELLGRVISVERGFRKVDFSAPNRWRRRATIRLLQSSDHATYLYVRLASFFGLLFCGRAKCRA